VNESAASSNSSLLHRGPQSQFTCFTSTKIRILTRCECVAASSSSSLLHRGPESQFTCFTSTKIRILTRCECVAASSSSSLLHCGPQSQCLPFFFFLNCGPLLYLRLYYSLVSERHARELPHHFFSPVKYRLLLPTTNTTCLLLSDTRESCCIIFFFPVNI
jgi:hypothetical protein